MRIVSRPSYDVFRIENIADPGNEAIYVMLGLN